MTSNQVGALARSERLLYTGMGSHFSLSCQISDFIICGGRTTAKHQLLEQIAVLLLPEATKDKAPARAESRLSVTMEVLHINYGAFLSHSMTQAVP